MTLIARRFLVMSAVLMVVALACPVAAELDPATADDDGDGVADALDQCPDTAAGDLVGADGCSVCPCDVTASGNAWGSHQMYMACVVGEARNRRADGTMTSKSVRHVIRMARHSTCGNAQLTRCCVYANFDDEVGSCRTTTPDACETLDDGADDGEADDIGAGSCAGNPCAF
jgi:hypothetical protein